MFFRGVAHNSVMEAMGTGKNFFALAGTFFPVASINSQMTCRASGGFFGCQD